MAFDLKKHLIRQRVLGMPVYDMPPLRQAANENLKPEERYNWTGWIE